MQLRVTLPVAVTAIALVVGAVALLSGCDGTDQQPAATTPTATVLASPSPTATVMASPSPTATAVASPSPTVTVMASPSPTATAVASPSPTASGGVDAPETAGSTRPASTPTREPHGRDGPATTTPVPATPTLVPAPDPGGRAATPGAITRGRTAAGSGTPTPEPGPVGAAGPRTVESTASAFAAGGSVPYTWQDGEHTRRVYLQPNLVLQDPADNTSEDVVVRAGRMENVVQRTARHDEQDTLPVFRSASGSIMTLPGGVLLVFDEQWDQPRINTFVATNGIDKGSIRALDFTPNAFFIDTAPGLASLELANALAAEEGVVISSPNWRREVVPR